jgi:hypothetical protein
MESMVQTLTAEQFEVLKRIPQPISDASAADGTLEELVRLGLVEQRPSAFVLTQRGAVVKVLRRNQ